MQSMSVDLVVDAIPYGQAELKTPADRLDVGNLPVFDYIVYPLASAVADKLCAVLELHDERPSSRVKDLVDILMYATTERVDGSALLERIQIEAATRRLVLPKTFSAPTQWHKNYRGVFTKLCKQTGIPSRFHVLDQGEDLARAFLDPVLNNEVDELTWDFRRFAWVSGQKDQLI
jgi:hypothetical protein